MNHGPPSWMGRPVNGIPRGTVPPHSRQNICYLVDMNNSRLAWSWVFRTGSKVLHYPPGLQVHQTGPTQARASVSVKQQASRSPYHALSSGRMSGPALKRSHMRRIVPAELLHVLPSLSDVAVAVAKAREPARGWCLIMRAGAQYLARAFAARPVKPSAGYGKHFRRRSGAPSLARPFHPPSDTDRPTWTSIPQAKSYWLAAVGYKCEAATCARAQITARACRRNATLRLVEIRRDPQPVPPTNRAGQLHVGSTGSPR
jgi:hypothetical protein